MSLLGQRALDPLEWVEGDGTRYSCPTVEATLGHLRAVQARLANPESSPLTLRRARHDLDVLLDRLSYLRLMSAGGSET